jgi:uncharacterized protein YbaP (TraB family)
MYKLLASFAALFACIIHVSAQTRLEKTLLWEISGNGLAKPSYIYGTIHLMCPEDLHVSETLQKTFSATKELFLEIKTDDPGMMTEMLAGMQMKDTLTIEGLLGPGNYDSVSTIFTNKTGIPLKMLNKAKPILVVSMVYPSLMGCTPDSWEKTFETMAKKNNIPLKGLETISDQMKLLESIPYKEQAEMLMKTLYNLDSARAQFGTMLNIYKSKDLQTLYDLTVSDVDFGEYETSLLVNRNRNWIPIIKEQVRKTPTFFAVGAAHLAGENGVLNLLRKEGLTIRPVMY